MKINCDYVELRMLAAGDVFKLSPKGRVYHFGELRGWKWVKYYDRTEKKYYCTSATDVSDGIHLNGNKKVFINFIY